MGYGLVGTYTHACTVDDAKTWARKMFEAVHGGGLLVGNVEVLANLQHLCSRKSKV